MLEIAQIGTTIRKTSQASSARMMILPQRGRGLARRLRGAARVGGGGGGGAAGRDRMRSSLRGRPPTGIRRVGSGSPAWDPA
jgi:hypothetical protein